MSAMELAIRDAKYKLRDLNLNKAGYLDEAPQLEVSTSWKYIKGHAVSNQCCRWLCSVQATKTGNIDCPGCEGLFKSSWSAL